MRQMIRTSAFAFMIAALVLLVASPPAEASSFEAEMTSLATPTVATPTVATPGATVFGAGEPFPFGGASFDSASSSSAAGPPPVRVARYVVGKQGQEARASGSSISLSNGYLSPSTITSGAVFIFERSQGEAFRVTRPDHIGMRSGAVVLLPGFFHKEGASSREIVVVTATEKASAALPSRLMAASQTPGQTQMVESGAQKGALLAGQADASALYEAVYEAFSRSLAGPEEPRIYADPNKAPKSLEAVSRETEAVNESGIQW